MVGPDYVGKGFINAILAGEPVKTKDTPLRVGYTFYETKDCLFIDIAGQKNPVFDEIENIDDARLK